MPSVFLSSTAPPAHRRQPLAWGLLCGVLAWCLLPQIGLMLQGSAAGGLPPLAWSLAGCMLLLALPPRPAWGALALLPVAALAPAELWYVLNYQRPSDAHVLGILSETDLAEASAFAGGEIGAVLAGSLAGVLLCVAAAVRAWRTGLAWRPARLRWLLLGGALAALVPPALAYWQAGGWTAEPAPGTPLLGRELARNEDPLLSDLARTFPTGLPLRLHDFRHHVRTLRELDGRLAGFRFGARQRPAALAAPGRQLHLLVIGETGRPDRWQLNGYARPTTPRLAALDGVVSFRDMVSPWAWTRMSVPVILTRKPATDRNPFFAERSLISAFREAGYRTYWFSTQSPLGGHDSSTRLLAQEADETRFVNAAGYQADAGHDDALLPWLDTVLARDEPRQLVVLHTLGSHYNYSHRHPPAFERFTPSLRGHPAPNLHDPAQAVPMGNAYDNSVAFTDHLLAEVIARLAAADIAATLFYVADHGENLFDGGCPLSGHGRDTERDFRVASLFWASEPYRRQSPGMLDAARARADAPLSTTQVLPSLLALADVRLERPDARGAHAPGSLFSQAMAPGTRLLHNGLDFDLAEREGTCKILRKAGASVR